MLIWINGPFGIGKTTTARALRSLALQRGLRARIYDPELFGSFLHRVIPAGMRPEDFRDQRLWDVGTQLALRTASRSRGLVIVPMCISSPQQLRSLTVGCAANLFRLTAQRSLIEDRIHGRTFAVDWSMRQLETWPDTDDLGKAVHASLPPAEIALILLDAIESDAQGGAT